MIDYLAEQQAIEDIKRELESCGRCFIAFHRELNEPIEKIVKEYLKLQKEIK